MKSIQNKTKYILDLSTDAPKAVFYICRYANTNHRSILGTGPMQRKRNKDTKTISSKKVDFTSEKVTKDNNLRETKVTSVTWLSITPHLLL